MLKQVFTRFPGKAIRARMVPESLRQRGFGG